MYGDKFFFERELDSQKEFYKIFVLLLIVATVLGGMVLYFAYTGEIEKNPILAEARCGFGEASIRQIGGGAKDVGGVQKLIEQSVDEPRVSYLSLKPTEQCGGDVGMWFNNHDGSRMYAYCLGVYQGRLVRFEKIDCRGIDHEQSIGTSLEAVSNASRVKIPGMG